MESGVREREVQEQRTYVYVRLIHIVYSRKQHNLVEAITLQFKINLVKARHNQMAKKTNDKEKNAELFWWSSG